MVGLEGKTACLSRNGRGGIGTALRQLLLEAGVEIVDDSDDPSCVDFAICTAGKMIIREAGDVNEKELDELYTANYKYPRQFTERHIHAMRQAKKSGLILHLGSNSARYGASGVEDYSGFKAALCKYLELRGRSVREDGIRLSILNLGAVDTVFWEKVRMTADPKLTQSIIPNPEKALTAQEVTATVLSILAMPERMTIKDALMVSVDYQ